jgi:hypothetical protein
LLTAFMFVLALMSPKPLLHDSVVGSVLSVLLEFDVYI